MVEQERMIRLRDGRTLAYTGHGDPDGKPVIFIHGSPGSRLMRHPDESIAVSLGARIVTPDRPGYGLSDYQPGRTLLDFPDDMAQLADALGIDRFAIFGVSAGGPYVAAAAYQLPDRLTHAAIVSGVAPFDRSAAEDSVGSVYRTAYRLAAWPVWLLRLLLAMQNRAALADPEKSFQQTLKSLSPADRELLADPAIKAQVMACRPEATRRGVRGWVADARLLVASWGFDLAKIEPTIHLWYWADDPAVPPQMGAYLDQKIPHTVPHFLPGGGHFSLFSHWRQILEPLVVD